MVPRALIEEVLRWTHDSKFSAHPGKERTYLQTTNQFYWKGMRQDIDVYIDKCQTCQTYKGHTHGPTKMTNYAIPNRPMERVHMDLLTNFNETSRANKHILVVVDALTRYTELIPLTSKRAQDCASAFFSQFICRHGVPEILVTDCGGEFQNKFMDSLCSLFEINKLNIAPYNPSSNGLVERANRKVLEVLRTTIGGQDPNWDISLKETQFTLNTAYHSSIEMSPHAALYGIVARYPYDLTLKKQQIPEPLHTHILNAKFRGAELKDNLHKSNSTMQDKQHKRSKGANIAIGDIVYIKVYNRNELNWKLGPKFHGPYKVIEMAHAGKAKLQNLNDNTEVKEASLNNLTVVKNHMPTKRVTFES